MQAPRHRGELIYVFGEEPIVRWDGRDYPVLDGETDLPPDVHAAVSPWINQYYTEVAVKQHGRPALAKPWRRLPHSSRRVAVLCPGTIPASGVADIKAVYRDRPYRWRAKQAALWGDEIVLAHPGSADGFVLRGPLPTARDVTVEWWSSNLWFHLDMRFGAQTFYRVYGESDVTTLLRETCTRDLSITEAS